METKHESTMPINDTPKKKEFTITINSQAVFSILVVVLVAVSLIQTTQLIALKRAVSTGIFNVQPANAASTGGALPNMVGGC